MGKSVTLAVIALQCAFCANAFAQAAPSADEMVERLRPQPRTRSLRNLIVEGAPQQQEPRPSLSLQIQFEFDSAQVRPESEPALQNLAKALQASELANSRFAVEGHTDAKGRADYNRQLSRRRADAVRDLLAQYGADPARLVTSGKGSSEPAIPGDPFAAENRRVRVVNLD